MPNTAHTHTHTHPTHHLTHHPTPHTTTVLSILPLGFPREEIDQVMFCVHYDDRQPKGNAQFDRGPAWLAATSVLTLPARTAGACTTAARCRVFRHIRTVASRR